ncbi:hypothetical protein NC652_041102 [Populus alba x Populus x berolinensis]|nr:hypothetical protein NC652_041102 [Populus alba x Populus x berolinensis]
MEVEIFAIGELVLTKSEDDSYGTKSVVAFHLSSSIMCKISQFYFFTSCSVDDGFPDIKFHFQDSLTLTVYPHDYLKIFGVLGGQNGGMQSKDGRDMTLLGGSSSIKVKDEKSGSVYSVGAENLSSASPVRGGRIVTFLLLLFAMLHRFT